MNLRQSIAIWLTECGGFDQPAVEAVDLMDHLVATVDKDSATAFCDLIGQQSRLAALKARRAADAERKRRERAGKE